MNLLKNLWAEELDVLREMGWMVPAAIFIAAVLGGVAYVAIVRGYTPL